MRLDIVSPDSDFVRAVLRGLSSNDSSLDGGRPSIPASTPWEGQQIAEICNVAFWASLEQDEGRMIQASFALASPDQFPNPLVFQTPQPLDIPTVVSLASAAVESVLGVQASVSGELAIWGITNPTFDFGTRVSIIKPGTVGVFLERGFLPNVAAIIDKGELIVPSNASLLTFQDLLAQSFGGTRSIGDRFQRAGQLMEVVHTMTDHGHGGTLVTVPHDDSWKQHLSIRYPCGIHAGSDFLKASTDTMTVSSGEVSSVGASLTMSLVQPSVHSLKRKAHEDRHLAREALHRVGQLTSIDGAVIVGENLIVHGFGAILTPPETDFELTSVDALTGRTAIVPVGKLGGSRHQSAARFVKANERSITFISSQDGGLTLVGRTLRDRSVMAVQNLQHLFAHWRGPVER